MFDPVRRTPSQAEFNVRDYGAKGDGVTDDTTKIQAAITAAQVAGGTVRIPHGVYLTTDELLITKDGVRIVGDAVSEALPTGTCITCTSSSKDVVRVTTSVQSVSGFEMENIFLYGAGNGGSAGSGLYFESNTAGRLILGIRLANVSVKNCKQHGIRFSATDATSFIFDMQCDKIRVVNNYGSGIRADGLVIQTVWEKLYSEYNADSQIKLVGADQTTTPQNWLMMGAAASSNPNTAGTAAIFLENVKNFQSLNVWHESNQNAEMILKSCKGIKIDGGRITQSGTVDGIVIGFSGAFACGAIEIDIPGWTNTSSKTRIDLSQFAGGSITAPISLGNSADGAMTQVDVTGYASAFLPDMVYFTGAGAITHVANIIGVGVTITGTWTTPASLPTFNQRTAANNTTHQRGWWFAPNAGDALVNSAAPLKGIQPIRVEIVYAVTGGDAGDDFNVALTSQPWPADNSAVGAATSITTSVDTAHNSAAKRSNSSGGHQHNRMVHTITTPAWLGEGEVLVVTATATEANDAANALSIIVKAVLVYYNSANP